MGGGEEGVRAAVCGTSDGEVVGGGGGGCDVSS